MIFGDDCKRIVRTEAGLCTGETRYQTADGRWWKQTSWPLHDMTNSPEVRYLHGNSLCSSPHGDAKP